MGGGGWTFSGETYCIYEFLWAITLFILHSQPHTRCRSKWSNVHEGVTKVFSKTVPYILFSIVKKITRCESKSFAYQ